MSIASSPDSHPRSSLKQTLTRLAQPPGRISTFVAIATFTLSIIGLSTPAGPFFIPGIPESFPLANSNGFLWLPQPSAANPLIHAVISMTLYVCSGFSMLLFFGPMLLVSMVISLFTSEGGFGDILGAFIFILPSSLWCLLCLNWGIRLIAQLVRWRRQRGLNSTRLRFWRSRWLVTPVLGVLLYGLWITQLPLKAAFSMQKGALERIADASIAEPSGTVEFQHPRLIAPASVTGAYRLPRGGIICDNPGREQCIVKAEEKSVVSIPIKTMWAHAGYVRDLSRQPGQIQAHFFSFEENSNHFDQEINYLNDGWYVFQNAFD